MRTYKMTILCACAILLIFLLTGHVLGEKKPKIGIMRFDVSKNIDPVLGGFLYDVLLERMVASGQYTVVDWEEIDRVLQYIAESQPNISDEDAKKQAVDQLGIERMYVGTARKVGSKFYISVKVLNLDLTVSRVVRKSTNSQEELEATIKELASELTMSIDEIEKARQKATISMPQSGKKARLFVKTTPPEAQVRILNIKPRYRDGIELIAGNYHIEVSKAGFVTQERWVSVSTGEQKTIHIQLIAREPAPKMGATWLDSLTGMEFVWIPGGCFKMGSPEGEVGRSMNEGPEHTVCVDGFWMSKTEVTNEQYQKSKPGHQSGAYAGYRLDGSKQPVVRVSWHDAKAFGMWLTKRNGGQYKFRLPTEAEWEYACRAGEQASRFWGNSSNNACRFSNVMDLSAQKALATKSSHNCTDGFIVTAPVGSFSPNRLQLYDMLGNVMEWSEDIYVDNAYSMHSHKNPAYKGNGARRVMRGGSWSCIPKKVRSAYRDYDESGRRFPDVGFRLIKTP